MYPLLYAFFFGATKVGALFSPKLSRAHRERKGLIARIQEGTRNWEPGAWWLHIASSGELEQALPLLDAIRRVEPKSKIFLSYFSPSAKDGLKFEIQRRQSAGRPIPWDLSDYSPYDFPSFVEPYVDALRPRGFISIHRELWPGISAACRRRGIPVMLMAASFPHRNKNLPRWQKKQLEQLTAIGVTRPEAAEWLKGQLHGPKIRVVGDPRVERVLTRRQNARPAPWRAFFEGQRVFLAASIWPKDFEALRPTLEGLKGTYWRVILVPHEPKDKFVDFLHREMKAMGFRPRLWTRWLESPDTESTLILDQVGFLAELYQVSRMVFIGGSFHHRVHNILEPAAYGCRLFTGPLMLNSLEGQEMRDEGLLIAAQTPLELADAVLKTSRTEFSSGEPLNYLVERAKSSEACLELIQQK